MAAPWWARKVAAMILPWPARHERMAAVEAARLERLRSQELRDKAAELEQQIRQMAADNHFADAIARQIIGGGR